MERLYKQYLTLTAGQRKLLCFLAYTGKELDSDLIRLYAKCEDIARENVKKTANALTQYLSSYSFYREDYLLDNYHVAPLCLYMLKVMPQWVTYFDTFYKRLQAPDYFMLLSSNYVIHLDPWWNPPIEQQATDRA
jgi:SNF2 family DNA or RNA helicase